MLMLCVSPGEGLNIQYYRIKTQRLKESVPLVCLLHIGRIKHEDVSEM